MIQSQDTTQEVFSNSTNTSHMAIEASAEAFEILSSAIYEHKIAAVVRELCCNAYDSQVEADRAEVPFHIQFPTMLDPHFIVTDEGVGLDDEGVRNVFMKFFKSTKRNTNKATGYLGLGAHSPHSYCSSYSIRARKNGIERGYVCYLDENSIPTVNKLYEVETEEHNGVSVKVPVNEMDFRKFRDEASFILSFFDTVPNTTDPHFEVAYPYALKDLNDNGVAYLKSPYFKSNLYNVVRNDIFINMGNVCYRITDRELFSDDVDEIVRDVFKQVINQYNGVVFRVPMGSVKFSASRERLSLKPATLKTVQDTVLQVAFDKIEEIQKKIDEKEHYLESIKVLVNEFGGYSLIRVARSFKFKGKPLNKWAKSHHKIVDLVTENWTLFQSGSRHNQVRKYFSDNATVSMMDLLSHKAYVLYYEKKKFGIVKQARKLITDRLKTTMVVALGEPTSKLQASRIARHMNAELVNLEELVSEEKRNKPKLPKGERAPKIEKTEVDATYVSGGGMFGKTRHDLNDGNVEYYYIDNPEDGVQATDNSSAIILDKLQRMIDLGRNVHLYRRVMAKNENIQVRILIKNKQNGAKIERNKIPNVEEFYKTMQKWCTDNKDAVLIRICRLSSKTHDALQTYLDVSKSNTRFYKENKDKFKTFEGWKKITESNDRDSSLDRFVKMYSDDVMEDFASFSEELDELKDLIFITYPMIKWVNVDSFSMYESEKLKDMSNYVKMVDQTNEEEKKDAKAA